MTTKPPLCKVCGRPVPKHTQWHSWSRSADGPAPLSKAAFQATRNDIVVSVSWNHDRTGLAHASTWDGETYAWGGHFHAQSCAAIFGRSMADLFPDYAMPEHREALAALKERAR
jgi:hypothetical protein